MMKQRSNPISGHSLYTTLGIIIVTTVIAVISVHSASGYFAAKEKLVAQMQKDSRNIIASLQKNVADKMAAYAINEYETLVRNEMEQDDTLAIVIEDYNMGKILGQASYLTGKIRERGGKIVDYDSDNAEHRQLLSTAYHTTHDDIIGSGGRKLGTISVYLSGNSLNKAFDNAISETFSHAAILSFFLILLLFVSIRLFILKPISTIVRSIGNSDEDGIPIHPVPTEGPREIFTLSAKINRMIEAIRESRNAIIEQHDYLQAIIDGVDDSIMVIDTDYNIQLMNRSAQRLIKEGYVIDPLRPRCYQVAHHRSTPCEPGDHPCPLATVLETKSHAVTIHRHIIRGEERYIEISATPLFDNEGACVGIIEASRDITHHLEAQEKLREQQKEFEHQATHDSLTGLANRTLFKDRLEQGIAKAKRQGSKLALLFIDLDHFKEINDSLGHKIGDTTLKIVAERLRDTLREEDTLARLGGDEFSVIVEGLSDVQGASVLADKILKVISQPMQIEEHVCYIGCSIGISLYPDNGTVTADLLKYADAAMYNAKHEGRNTFQYYSSDMTERALERVMLETSMREGLKNDEFIVYFQPQIDGRNGKLIGMEALMRWQNPELGLVSPAKFIPIAEATGFIVELDRHMMRKAMAQCARWRASGHNPGVLAMNLTAKQLQQKDFFDILEKLIEDTGCQAQWLELEVTESQIMVRPEEASALLARLSALGVKLAIDDFGTGYSSLSYLKKFPLNKLKIDRSFIRDLPHDEEDAAITRSIIALANNLNLALIAEGVETEEQRRFLIENGCNQMQGYLYSKPLPPEEMEIALSTRFR